MYEVRRLRQEKGWNQNELAFHADLAPSVISQIETGKREPSATTLRKLAEALEVEIPDLFERSDSPKAQAPQPLEFEEQHGADGALAAKLQKQLETQLRVLRERQSIARSDEDLHEAANDFHHWWLNAFDLLNVVIEEHPEDRGPKLEEVVNRAAQAVKAEVPKDAPNPRHTPEMLSIVSAWGTPQDANA